MIDDDDNAEDGQGLARGLLAVALWVIVAVVLMAASGAFGQTATPTETPTETVTETPTATPTPTPFGCSGTLMAADVAGNARVEITNGNTCTVGENINRSDLSVYLGNGTFDTAGYDLTMAAINYADTNNLGIGSANSILSLGDSIVTLTGALGGATQYTITVNYGTSKIRFVQQAGAAPHNFPYYDLWFEIDNTSSVGWLNARHVLHVAPGAGLDLSIGHVQAATVECSGTVEAPIVLSNNGNGTPAFDVGYVASEVAQVVCDHATITGVYCTGIVPCIARNSTDGGGNTGWCFGDEQSCPAVTWTPTSTPTRTPTQTPTDTPTPEPPQASRCCQLTDLSGFGHAGSTCVDNAVMAGWNSGWQYVESCAALASMGSTTVETDGYESGNLCNPEGDMDGVCVAGGPTATSTPAGPTNTPTPTPTARPDTIGRLWFRESCPSPPCDSTSIAWRGRKSVAVDVPVGTASVDVLCVVGNSSPITLGTMTGADCGTVANCLLTTRAACDDLYLQITTCDSCEVSATIRQ